jgi:hypothetical protein
MFTSAVAVVTSEQSKYPTATPAALVAANVSCHPRSPASNTHAAFPTHPSTLLGAGVVVTPNTITFPLDALTYDPTKSHASVAALTLTTSFRPGTAATAADPLPVVIAVTAPLVHVTCVVPVRIVPKPCCTTYVYVSPVTHEMYRSGVHGRGLPIVAVAK